MERNLNTGIQDSGCPLCLAMPLYPTLPYFQSKNHSLNDNKSPLICTHLIIHNILFLLYSIAVPKRCRTNTEKALAHFYVFSLNSLLFLFFFVRNMMCAPRPFVKAYGLKIPKLLKTNIRKPTMRAHEWVNCIWDDEMWQKQWSECAGWYIKRVFQLCPFVLN